MLELNSVKISVVEAAKKVITIGKNNVNVVVNKVGPKYNSLPECAKFFIKNFFCSKIPEFIFCTIPNYFYGKNNNSSIISYINNKKETVVESVCMDIETASVLYDIVNDKYDQNDGTEKVRLDLDGELKEYFLPKKNIRSVLKIDEGNNKSYFKKVCSIFGFFKSSYDFEIEERSDNKIKIKIRSNNIDVREVRKKVISRYQCIFFKNNNNGTLFPKYVSRGNMFVFNPILVNTTDFRENINNGNFGRVVIQFINQRFSYFNSGIDEGNKPIVIYVSNLDKINDLQVLLFKISYICNYNSKPANQKHNFFENSYLIHEISKYEMNGNTNFESLIRSIKDHQIFTLFEPENYQCNFKQLFENAHYLYTNFKFKIMIFITCKEDFFDKSKCFYFNLSNENFQ